MSKTDNDKRAEGAAIATTVIESLRNQPFLLGMLVMQFILLAFLYFGITEGRKRDHLINKFILERCLPSEKVPT
jgi:hypothetical protein